MSRRGRPRPRRPRPACRPTRSFGWRARSPGSGRGALSPPVQDWLDDWREAEPAPGVRSIQQPTMQPLPMIDARPAGDTLLALAKAAGFPLAAPAWLDYLKSQWLPRIGAGQPAW